MKLHRSNDRHHSSRVNYDEPTHDGSRREASCIDVNSCDNSCDEVLVGDQSQVCPLLELWFGLLNGLGARRVSKNWVVLRAYQKRAGTRFSSQLWIVIPFTIICVHSDKTGVELQCFFGDGLSLTLISSGVFALVLTILDFSSVKYVIPPLASLFSF